ncbi:MAG: hypothetical protein K8L97_30515 [Anaerolineae bacterium]|nr:hypothetical protein [Anaerolineae bacterium]
MRITVLVSRYVGMVAIVVAVSAAAGVWLGREHPRSTLAFMSDRAGKDQIYMLDRLTGNTLQITPDDYEHFQPAWGESQFLIYTSYPMPMHITVMDIQAGKTHTLNTSHDVYEPDWSPKGHIAAASNPNLDWDIALFDSSRATYPATFNSEANELEPCWWDDHRMSFVSNRGGDYDIYLYDFASESLTNLTDSPATDYNPACSADGRLAFTSTRDFNAEVYVLDLETGEAENVTRNSASDFNPAWMQDGQLSFVSDRDGNREIYVLNLDTGQMENVTRNPADDDQPAWSR